MDITSQLNEQQQEAVRHFEGPLLILAGAGSGKTKVITSRIADLILNRNVAPWSILAVTFTNKASEEMRLRVKAMVGKWADDVLIKTFHSACLYILRQDGYHIGIPSFFTIYDSQDSESLIKQILKSLELDPKKFSPKMILSTISRQKDQLIDAKSTLERYENSGDYFHEVSAKVYKEYEERMREANALDFNDLLMRTVQLFMDREAVLQKYREMWQYILVDEYQDTNRVQYLLTRMLAKEHRNLCVVGDDDQSIYSWRGADIRNILDFQKDFSDAKVVKLEENYRSTSIILDAAYHVVKQNENRMEKKLWTRKQGGEKIQQKILYDDRDEAMWCVEQAIFIHEEKNVPYDDMAIFYRMNYQSRTFEEFLRSQAIPYVIYGGIKFYERKEVKDILSYVRFIVNPSDNLALQRIINTPTRGIGAKSMEKLSEKAQEDKISLWEALQREEKNKKIISFVKLIQEFMDEISSLPHEMSLYDFVYDIVDKSGYRESLEKEDSPEADSRQENIQELLNSIADWEDNISQNEEEPDLSLERYLQEIGLYTDAENPDKQNGDRSTAIKLMTVHNAKGLEFNTVFLCGMEEGIFPHGSAVNNELELDADEMEEERRLCYVGITRAKERLFMSAARYRRQYGTLTPRYPSRFLNDVPPEYLEISRDSQSFAGNSLYRNDGNGGAFFRDENQSERFIADETDDSGKAFANNLQKGRDPFVSMRQQLSNQKAASFGNKRNTGEGLLKQENHDPNASQMGYYAGQKVRHPAYGEGVIQRIVKNGNFVRLYISFQGRSAKAFLEKYTPLEKLS